ncbi:hypothetical protein DL93DRAFT_2121720, partial [Clavulina sp. PMI_390]
MEASSNTRLAMWLKVTIRSLVLTSLRRMLLHLRNHHSTSYLPLLLVMAGKSPSSISLQLSFMEISRRRSTCNPQLVTLLLFLVASGSSSVQSMDFAKLQWNSTTNCAPHLNKLVLSALPLMSVFSFVANPMTNSALLQLMLTTCSAL